MEDVMTLNAETIGIFIAFLVCMGAMFKFFMSRLDRRFEAIDKRFEKIDSRFDKVDARFDELEKKFDTRCTRIEEKIDDLTQKVHELDLKVGDINLRVSVTEMRMEERRSQPIMLPAPTRSRSPVRRTARKPKTT